MTSLWDKWRPLSSFTRSLFAFVLVNSFAFNLPLLLWASGANTLQYAAAAVQRIAFGDSWTLMIHALQYLHIPQIQALFSNKPLYTVLFFDQHIKFIYPPTSLILLESFRLISRDEFVSHELLNTISWIGLVAAVLIIVLIFFGSLRRYSRLIADWTQGDKYMLAVVTVVAALTFYPFTRAFVIGQIQLWIDVLFAGLALAWMKDKKDIAGICGGLICAIKPQLGLLIVLGSSGRNGASWLRSH